MMCAGRATSPDAQPVADAVGAQFVDICVAGTEARGGKHAR